MSHGVGVQLPELRTDTPRLCASRGLHGQGRFSGGRSNVSGEELAFGQADAVERVGAPGFCTSGRQGSPNGLCGLGSVSARVAAGELLHAGEILASRFEPSAVWGMSPFAGKTADPVWARFDPRLFLRAPERVDRAQAAFRVAFHLPEASKLAVSCNSAEHLSDLVESLAQEVDPTAVADYRRLLTGAVRRTEDP
ncbi:hypothetical protein [Streptomyces cyaneofuscatus]|uniref:hypothetical protein n=1 Tax=Streptomyces cyaneofuscatus TaxID=66883 RepID=UPI003436B515